MPVEPLSVTLSANRRKVLALAALAPLMPQRAGAQTAPCSVETADEARLRTDFPWLDRYARDNAQVLASGVPTNIVFMGDSITQGWRDKHPAFFPDGRVNRGIGGQTTPQMLLRMMADVIALKPVAVHIMGGTNDIAGNTGPMSPDMTCNNIAAMATLARANGLRVLLASIPPAANFPWRPGLDTRTPIARINTWFRDYALREGHVWVDYHPALANDSGGMEPGLAVDGVHPTPTGYDAMEAVLLPVLRQLHLA
ncbi:MAG: GDSL family lipase [Sphingomonadales bacterium]|nr:GDSL family lipase [Sphingomonadales bacterium]MDE2170900.1 GDSL family lipase [Sphingomonadales bacterium]